MGGCGRKGGLGVGVTCKVPPVCAVIMIYVKLIAHTHTQPEVEGVCERDGTKSKSICGQSKSRAK